MFHFIEFVPYNINKYSLGYCKWVNKQGAHEFWDSTLYIYMAYIYVQA